MGLGLGMSMQILILIVQNTFPVTEVGTATASNNYFRQIGASLGSAIVGSLFVAKLTHLLSERMPAGAASASGGENSLTPAVVRDLPAGIKNVIVSAYNDALTPVFLYMVPLGDRRSDPAGASWSRSRWPHRSSGTSCPSRWRSTEAVGT